MWGDINRTTDPIEPNREPREIRGRARRCNRGRKPQKTTDLKSVA